MVTLPAAVDTDGCEFHYFLWGPFGGRGEPAWPVGGTYEIPTVVDGVAARSMKAYVTCKGYQTETLAFNPLPPVQDRRIDLRPKPLGTVAIRGVVRGLPPSVERARNVEVLYSPSWVCEFCNLADCLLPFVSVAVVPVDADGWFAAALPDFARDAGLSRFRNRGRFHFRVVDAVEGRTRSVLADLRGTTTSELPVAESYPGILVLEAPPAK